MSIMSTETGARAGLGRMLGPGLTLRELNLICWGLFFAFLVVPFCVVAIAHSRNGSPLAKNPEVDFVYLYGMGRILNQYPPDKLYNFEVERKVFAEIHPLKTGAYGPIAYAPYIGILFRPFARLSLSSAYLLWVSISFLLYVAGLGLLCARYVPHDRLRQSLVFCFALSFYPFVNWTLLSGHISTIGFLAFAWAFREEDLGHPLWSGVALSGCLYKPTLLVLFLPMLILTRRFRTLLGFGAGAFALALFAAAVEGVHVWSGYFHMLFSFGFGTSAVHAHSFRQLWKYVDIASLLSSIHGGAFWVVLIAVLAGACWAAWELISAWWKSAEGGGPAGRLIWATALTWTMILNVYVPIYDSILVVISVIATAGAFRQFRVNSLYRRFTILRVLIWIVSWFTVGIAEAIGIQLLTLLFIALGVLQLAALRRMQRCRQLAGAR
jgi:hypothetical protein